MSFSQSLIGLRLSKSGLGSRVSQQGRIVSGIGILLSFLGIIQRGLSVILGFLGCSLSGLSISVSLLGSSKCVGGVIDSFLALIDSFQCFIINPQRPRGDILGCLMGIVGNGMQVIADG